MPPNPAARPNILWVMTEDLSPMTGVYGNPVVRTPATDALAAEGVLFENAFCTAPVCAPSRFSVITGVYPASCAPGHQMEGEARVRGVLPSFAELMRAEGYYCLNNVKTHYNSDLVPAEIWDECSRTAHWRGRPDGAPFLACFMPQVTHESAVWHQEITRVQPDEVIVPAYLPDLPEIRADLARYHTAIETIDAEVGELIEQLREDGLLEDTIVIWTSDHGGSAPRSKRFCYDSGLGVPLVVRVPERWRHLSRWAPGTRVTTPVSQLDLTPTLFALAGAEIPAHLHGRALFGAATEDLPGLVFGARNRMDERLDMIRTVRDERFRYLRNYSPHRPWGQHLAFMWNAVGYQAWERAHLAGELSELHDRFWHPKPAEELYDCVADPDQIRDLAPDPAYADELARLRAALDAHLLAIGDQGFLPETSGLEGLPAPDAAAYPLAAVMELAAAAIARDPANLARFVGALGEPAEVIRYWGAQGLLMLGGNAAPAVAALRSGLADESLPVRIALAEALGAIPDGLPESVAALTPLAGDQHPWQIRLMAIDALTQLLETDGWTPELTAAALAAAQPGREDEQEYVRGAARYLDLRLRGEYTPETVLFDWDRFFARIARYISADDTT